jgi:hypothetical protein
MVVAGFAAVAVLWGYGAAYAGDIWDWNPLVAPLSTALILAAFGWLRRGHDIPGAFGQAMLVSYAAFFGLALYRVTLPNAVAADWWIEPLNARWPAVLLVGIIYALILTIFVAVPIALVPVRAHTEIERNAKFLAMLSTLARRLSS